MHPLNRATSPRIFAGLSGERLISQLEIMTPTLNSGAPTRLGKLEAEGLQMRHYGAHVSN